jgi:2-polyprenyl-3-methyl-5-hydroxy-6-metoxy-1,4-benzoquinol methylase
MADGWAQEHADREDARYDEVIAKLKSFLPAGDVLEIEAGGGSDGALLAKAGYRYLDTDACAGMVRAARKSHPDIQFEQRSVYDLANINCQFDGFWVCAVLLHMPKARIDEVLRLR